MHTEKISQSLSDDKLTRILGRAEQEDSLEERVAIPHRSPQPCSNGGVARPNVLATDDRHHEDGKTPEEQ